MEEGQKGVCDWVENWTSVVSRHWLEHWMVVVGN